MEETRARRSSALGGADWQRWPCQKSWGGQSGQRPDRNHDGKRFAAGRLVSGEWILGPERRAEKEESQETQAGRQQSDREICSIGMRFGIHFPK